MGERLRRLRPYLGMPTLFAALGFATYWAWIDSVFFSGVLFGSFGDAATFSQRLHIVAQVVAIALTLGAAALAGRSPQLFSGMRGMSILAVLGTAGTVGGYFGAAFVSSPSESSVGLVLLGASVVAMGAVMGLLPLFWGRALVDRVRGRETLVVCASLVAACAETMLASLVEPLGRLLAACFLLPFGLLCFAALRQGHQADPAAAGLDDSDEGARGGSAPLGTQAAASSWRFMLMLFVTSFAFGVLQTESRGLATLDFSTLSIAQLAARGAVALAVFGAVGVLGCPYKTVYRSGLLLMIASFMASPFLSEPFPGLGSVLVSLGYACIDLMMWTYAFDCVRVLKVNPVSFVGVLRAIMMVGVLAGLFASPWLLGEGPGSHRYGIGATAVAYLLVIGAIVLMDEKGSQGFWSVLNRARAEAGEDPSRRLRAISDAFGLTKRESEIMGLLVSGRSAPYIAEELFIAVSTVKYHSSRVFAKLGVHSKQELISFYEGWDERTAPKR